MLTYFKIFRIQLQITYYLIQSIIYLSVINLITITVYQYGTYTDKFINSVDLLSSIIIIVMFLKLVLYLYDEYQIHKMDIFGEKIICEKYLCVEAKNKTCKVNNIDCFHAEPHDLEKGVCDCISECIEKNNLVICVKIDKANYV